jgi:hypothetical protein
MDIIIYGLETAPLLHEAPAPAAEPPSEAA